MNILYIKFYRNILNSACIELQDTELGNFLRFVRTGEPTDEFTDNLQNEVNVVKSNEKWEVEYMTLLMRDNEKIKEGWEMAIEKFITNEIKNGLSREEAEEKAFSIFGNPEDEEE